jgi:Fur family iron response transcriptional regulator
MSRTEIQKKLRDRGVMPTAQRIEVAELLLSRPQHLSADQIIEKLHRAGSRVSKATVYNSLKTFSEMGLIKEINVDATRKYYDSTTDAHHHFYHVETGELTDIPSDRINIAGLPDLPEGTEQESVEVLIKVRDRNR